MEFELKSEEFFWIGRFVKAFLIFFILAALTFGGLHSFLKRQGGLVSGRVSSPSVGSIPTTLPLRDFPEKQEKKRIFKPEMLVFSSKKVAASAQGWIEKSRKKRAVMVSRGFPRNSPLRPYGKVFVEAADTYGHDYRLMPAIAIVESSGGLRCYNYNPFGWLKAGEGTGLRYFPSWKAAIWAEARFIKQKWGSVKNPSQMKGYCTNPAWAGKVRREMRKF